MPGVLGYGGRVSRSNVHDQMSALAEPEATGDTAELFADIRLAMQIPLGDIDLADPHAGSEIPVSQSVSRKGTGGPYPV